MRRHHIYRQMTVFTIIVTLLVSTMNPMVAINAYTVDDVVSVKTVDKDIMLSVTPNSPYSMSDISSKLDFTTALSGKSVNVTTRDIDATDLSNWYVYDHYDTKAYATEEEWENATGYNKNLRPYFAYKEADANNKEPSKNAVSMDAIADESTSYVWGNTYALNEHITASSQDGKAAMNFYGYGVNPYADFLFYPADSTGTKQVQYTIDAKDVRTHSLNSAGFLFNCATVNGYLTGYAMLFEYGVKSGSTGDTQRVIADSVESVSLYHLNRVSIDALHSSTALTLLGRVTSSCTLISKTDLSALTFADHFDVSDISLEITSNSLKAYMTEAGTNTDATDYEPKTQTLFDIQSYDSGADTYCENLIDTGYGGFGPIVGYQNHNCGYTSSYKYSNLRMSITSTSSVLDGVSDTDYTQNKDDGTTLSESDKYFVLIGDNTMGDEGYTDYFKRQSDAVFLEKLKQEHVVLITNLNTKQVSSDINGTDYNLEDYLGAGNVIQLTSDNLDDMMQELTSIIQKNTYFTDTAQMTKDAIDETDSAQSAANCIVTYNGFQVDTINRSRIPKAGITLKIENPVTFNVTEPTYSICKPDGTVVTLDSDEFVVEQSEWDSGVYTVTTGFKEGVKATTTFSIASCYNCYFNGKLERAGVDNDGLSLLTGTVGVNKAAVNGEYQTQLIPDTGYTLPAVVNVFVDADGNGALDTSEQLSTTDYTYDAATGELVVPADKVNGNLYIYADTGKVTYDIFPLQANGAATCSLYEDYTATFASGDAGYSLPEWITLKLGDKSYVVHNSETATSVGDGTIQYHNGVLTITSGVLADDLTVTALVGQFKITNELTHMETSNPSTYGHYGEEYAATLKAGSGYSLPSTIAVYVGDEEVTDDAYTYDRTTGDVVIQKESITDDITIRAAGVLNTYPVNTKLTHLSYSGDAVANADADYQAQLTADTGYSLPETVQIQVGDTILENAYKYDLTTGKLVIDKSAICDDITITASAAANTYAVSYRLSNLETNGASTATFGTYYGAGLSAADGYMLPSAITVQVADKTLASGSDYTYASDTGVFLIRPEAVTDTIVISAAGQEKEKQAEPDVSTFQIIKPEYENTKEGKIIGVTTEMEYSLDGGTWIPCTSDTIANLGVGTVQIRFRETDTKAKSAVATVNIESITSEYYIPTITVSKKMGLKQKFQIKLMHIKGAAVKCVSTNPKVATVTKKGVITAKKKGKTKVVITIIKGKHIVQYVANIKVSKKVPRNYSLAAFKTDYKSPSIAFYKKLNKGNTWRIKLSHTKNTQLLFESSNKNVAIVDEKGRVRGDNPGKAIITITVQNKEVTDKYFAVVRVVDENSTQDVSWLKVLK